MEKKTFKLYHGGCLMPWGAGCVVKKAKGFVWVSGCEGQDPTVPPAVEGREGFAPKVVEGAAAQTRLALEKMKARLEDMGTSLENMVHMVTYVKGPFPEGTGVVDSPNFCWDVIDEFFKEHCPNFVSDKNPPSWDLVGVASLAHKDMVFEIGCVAVLPGDE